MALQIYKDIYLMSDKKKKQIYTLPVDYAVDLIAEAQEQIENTTDLLEILSEDKLKNNFSHVIPIAIEILWANFSILKELNRELEDPVMHVAEESNDEEYILLEETILKLQSILLSRYYANYELNRLSFSVTIN